MRFYTTQHPFYCGLDLHARSMYVCVLSQDGAIRLHRNRQAAPEPFLKAVAPYRDGLVVAVECLFPWYWLADLCAQEGMPFVLGQALSMQAMHGGKAQHDQSDAQKLAAVLRGGMLPQTSGSPAPMRDTRALLRRRPHLMRKRSALLAHVHHTNSQYNLPAIGKKIAYKANRAGGAERCRDPAVQKPSRATWHSSPSTMPCSRTSHSLASQLPSPPMPLPSTCCKPCPALAKFSASYCSTQAISLTASPACKPSARTRAWSTVRTH